jgi:serine/threonine protein kinase
MLLDSVTFVQAVRQYRLLDTRQADELAQFAQVRSPDARALAKEMLGRGWLTAFQVNQLLQGRGGSLLLGSYVLQERLGEGGMGAVYKARNWKIGRIVALKLIRKECLDNETIVRRFHREIEAAAQLSHPNIIHAFDAGESDDGTHFFVMEYVAGTDLAKLVKQAGPLPVRTACDYIRQAALGLQHAHERGMVHRDIKPSNLFLATEGGLVKLLDMGLAKLTGAAVDGETTSALTQQGAVMGTPDYIAPEQTLDAHAADIRADLYSLGCTFYYLLTGRVPFPGGTLGQKIAQHLSRAPVPVCQLRPEVPARVAAVVARLMAKRPEERHQTPGDLGLELTSMLSTSQGVESPTITAVPGPTLALANPFAFSHPGQTLTEASAPTPLSSPAPLSRRVILLGVGGFLTLGVCVLLAIALLRSRPAADTGRAASEPSKTSEEKRPASSSGVIAELDTDAANSEAAEVIQGEYAGTVGGKPYGAQVVAEGKGRFVLYLLAGGLPGGGWDRQTRIRGAVWSEGAILLFRSDDATWRGQIADRRLAGTAPDGEHFTLRHMRRRSATLGAPPPAGAMVLFDGSGVEEWIGGQMEDGLLRAGAISKQTFQHCRLHLEFRLPFMPSARGQGRGNSGVFFQDRYEIQILDSFGLPTSNVDCGAIYHQIEPFVNMCLPPLAWQTYDIEFQAARFSDRQKSANAVITVRHNDVVIHDRTPITGPNVGNVELWTPGPLRLQAHGAPVVFRNLWIVPLP